jgi:hypothetical protein
MPYTGGPLNDLNGKMGISAPHKSVPVMKLIRAHKPKTRDELYSLIKSHFEKNCKCGIQSRGTVEDFGRKLYEAQLTCWGEHKYSLKECIQWEYDLFISQSLKGNRIERKAICELSGKIQDLVFEEAEGYLDEELRIDILIKRDEQPIAGIQVKPISFLKMREEVINFNKTANQKWGKPVYYLFYDDREIFTNMKEIMVGIMKY